MKKYISFIIIAASILLMTAGLLFGDLIEGILQKAVNICYECIGIG